MSAANQKQPSDSKSAADSKSTATATATATAAYDPTAKTAIPDGDYDKYNVPRDATDSQYVLNFQLSEWREIRRFFHTFGFVVIRNVLTDVECALTVSEVFDSLSRGTNGKFNRNDRKSWGVWPAEGMEQYASPQKAAIFTPQFLKVRTHPNVHAAFAVLFAGGGADISIDVKAAASGGDNKSTPSGTTTAGSGGSGGGKALDTAAVVASCEPLITNHDRANFFRPTDLNPKWATKPNLHLDMNAVCVGLCWRLSLIDQFVALGLTL